MIVTLDEAKLWLRIDGDEDDNLVQLLIDGAAQYILDATGRKWGGENNTAKICALAIIADNYENRETTAKSGMSIRPAIQSMIKQLTYTPDGDA